MIYMCLNFRVHNCEHGSELLGKDIEELKVMF